MISYLNLILLSAFILSSFIWVYVFAKKTSKLNNSFLIFSGNLLLWELSALFTVNLLPEELITISFKVSSISWFFIGFLFLNFVYSFVKKGRNLTLYIFLIISVIAIIISLSTDLIVHEQINFIRDKIFIPGILFVPILIFAIFSPIIYAIVILVKTYLFSEDTEVKSSTLLLIIGIIASALSSVLVIIILPYFLDLSKLSPYSSITSLILLIFVFRAIIKYDFLSLTEDEITINLLSTLQDGVILTNNSNFIIQINKSAKKFLNLSNNSNFKNITLSSILKNQNFDSEKDHDSFYIEFEKNTSTLASQNSEIANENSSINDRTILQVSYSKVLRKRKVKGKIFILKDVTLAIAAEKVLKKSKENLEKEVQARTVELTQTKNYIESIYNSISESIVVVNTKNVIINVNNSFLKLYGFKTQDIIDKDISTIFTDREFYKIHLQLQGLDIGNVISLDSYNSKSNGSVFPVSISAVKMLTNTDENIDEDPKEDCSNFQIILTISDMTEKKLNQARMKDSRNKARMVIQNINEAIFIVQNNDIKYFINKKLEEILGYSMDELISIPFHNFIHPEDVNKVNLEFSQIQEKTSEIDDDEKIAKSITFRMISSSGAIRWVEINSILKKWNSDPAFLIYLNDVTERKKAAIKLVENENQFRAFIDQANDFIIIKDLEGRYLKANEKFCNLLKMKEEDIIGKTPQDLGYPEDFINNTNKIDEEVIKEKKIIIENQKASKSTTTGTEWLEVTTFPILDNNNNVKYIGILSRDVTNQKRWEERLSSKHKQLQQAHGDLQKSHEIIVKQEKLASLGTMAAGIAHEINNPTQVIKFSMQSLDMNIRDISEVITFINSFKDIKNTDTTFKRVDSLIELIDDLEIDLALEELHKTSKENKKSVERIEHIIKSTKRMAYSDIEFSKCNINEIILDSITLVENNIKYNVKVTNLLSDDIPIFNGIPSELTQIFINLINNSKDSIIENNLSYDDALIFISSSYDASSGMIEITIKDNGKGIPDEILNNIFDPFFTTKKVGDGTGLGLNIVHRIVKAHKGTIKVDSVINNGTEFIITLPIL